MSEITETRRLEAVVEALQARLDAHQDLELNLARILGLGQLDSRKFGRSTITVEKMPEPAALLAEVKRLKRLDQARP